MRQSVYMIQPHFWGGFAPHINNSLRVFRALQCVQHLNVVRKQSSREKNPLQYYITL